MKPALSLIFFTVLSGAGLSLVALIGLVDAVAPGSLPAHALSRGALLGLLLAVAGFASSLLHLANPRQAWRSFARLRTSWLSREAAVAWRRSPSAPSTCCWSCRVQAVLHRVLAGAAACLLGESVLVCTAMIYASLKPVRQWRTPWTPANYLLLGNWSGRDPARRARLRLRPQGGGVSRLAALLGLCALAAKLGYWRAIDNAGDALTLERAIGVQEGVRGAAPVGLGRARLLDVGHSHATFLTDEFGFVLARRHARVLRALALALAFGLPLAWLASGLARWPLALAAAACCIIGLLIERGLFFAEAKHTVRLYHGDPRT